MKIMKLKILEFIQKAFHRNKLLSRRFLASKPNVVAHEHNHGILCLHWDIGAHLAIPMNVYIGSTYINLS